MSNQIPWNYLDKAAAAEKAMRDFSKMQHIIEETDAEIRQEEAEMAGVASPKINGLPRSTNPQAGEDRMIRGMEKIDVIQERFLQAREYMKWFLPAWNALSEDDRFVLDTFYNGENRYGTDAAYLVGNQYGIERSSAYRKKSRALDSLATLLYGR